MINIAIVLWILFIHWVADFVFQTDWQAKNKSSNSEALLNHTFIYSCIWLPFSIINFGKFGGLFVLITFVIHTIQDYFTSRLNTKLWKENKVHYFFVSIGFDQFLHFAQLLLTFYLLK